MIGTEETLSTPPVLGLGGISQIANIFGYLAIVRIPVPLTTCAGDS